MSSTATIFGSFPHPAARSAAAPDAARSAPDSIVDAHADRPLTVPATERGPAGSPWGAWLAGVRQAFDRWTESNAQSRADACVRDMARSDPRIMADLMHARSLDDSETLIEPVAAATTAPAAPALEAVPMVRQPHQRIAGQGWGRLIEDAYQHRFQHSRRQHG